MSKRSRREKRHAKHGKPRAAEGSAKPDSAGARRPASKKSATPAERGDDRLVAALDPGDGRVEWWVHAATLIFIAFCAFLGYLGMRPGGTLPVIVYSQAQIWLGYASLAILIVGAIACFRKPPLRRKGRVRALIMVVLVVGIGMTPFPYPSSREHEPSQVRFELPVDGPWKVYWGGDEREFNRYAGFFPDRRWALALVREVDGATHTCDGSALEHYHAYGQPVLAPAGGRVVAAVGDVPDHPPGERGPREARYGNHLVIEVAEGEYFFLCHLQADSLLVGVGDPVAPGQPLARVGHSGLATMVDEPHLEIHLQTTADAGLGEAIPWSFHGYRSGDRPVERGLPSGGVAADGRLVGETVERITP